MPTSGPYNFYAGDLGPQEAFDFGDLDTKLQDAFAGEATKASEQTSGNTYNCYICGLGLTPESQPVRLNYRTFFISVHEYCRMYISRPR